MCNYVVLFQTLDEEHTVRWKYTRLLYYFLDLREKPTGAHHIIKML
jgi:hypothetical protein